MNSLYSLWFLNIGKIIILVMDQNSPLAKSSQVKPVSFETTQCENGPKSKCTFIKMVQMQNL